ncbi:Uncharacterized protein GBIM_02573 [Gryllus bimaculatus]|nr:Uncharacterized protein GBIM_02573 [Gryllus bimaculatus]
MEESMSQELADLGMLEQGMTFQDKRDLLNVVRLSQKSARAEEEERKTKTWSPGSHLNDVLSSNPTTSNEVVEGNMCKMKDIDVDGEEGDINQDILSNLSMAVSDCDRGDQTHLKKENYCAPAIEYFGGISTSSHDSAADLKTKLSHVNSPNSPVTLSSKDSEVGSVSGDTSVLRNGCENEENDGPARECAGSDNENEHEIMSTSAKVKQRDLNILKKKKDDRERNIDVFSHSSETDSHNFLRNTVNKNQDRIPFYFVPEGMSLRKYIAYFKCCVNQYYKNLAVIQRNNIEHIEWGAPITMDSGFTSFHSGTLDGHGDSASKRYNFRDRYPKPKMIDFASENSEDAEEDESNDEDIFTPHHKKLPGIKLSTKRKNPAANDTMSTKKEKKESPPKKVPEDGESLEEDEQEDNQGGDISVKTIFKDRYSLSSRKRARKSRAKLLHNQAETQEDINEIVPSVAITSIIEPDIVIAEGPTLVPAQPQLDDITNQPSPLSVKQRRLQLKTKNNGRNRRKSEPQRKNPDIVIVDEDIKPPLEEAIDRVPCPICWQLFPASDIEEHASECNQYSPDNSSSSVKT